MSEPALLPLHCNWSEVPIERPQEGVERRIVTGRNAMICRLRFAPHTVTTPHDHPHEQLTLVIAGRVRFILGTRSFGVRRLVAAFCSPLTPKVRQTHEKRR